MTGDRPRAVSGHEGNQPGWQPPVAAAPRRRGDRMNQMLRRSGIGQFSGLYAMALLIVVFTCLEGRLFWSTPTLRGILGDGGIEGLLALGVLVPFVAGLIDLQFAFVAGTGLVIMSDLSNSSINIWLAALITIAVCTAFGLLSGFLVSRLGVSSLIVTLGVGQLALGLGWLLIGTNVIGATITNPVLLWLGNGTLGPVPASFLVVLLLAILSWLWLERTPWGRYTQLTGSNPVAARLAGIHVARIQLMSLTYSSFIAGATAVIWCAQVQSASNAVGAAYLFPVVSIVLLGSTQVRNRLNVAGTIIALLLLETAVQGVGLKESGNSTWIPNFFAGAFLLAALGVAKWHGRGRQLQRVKTRESDVAGQEPRGGSHMASA
jgi:ribose transport system permease protein